MIEDLAQMKVGHIVAANFRTSTVLTGHQIDFCCGGGATLREACQDKQQDLEIVIEELEEVLQTREDQNWHEMQLDNLVDLIVDDHHNFVRATIPALKVYLDKLCAVHGSKNAELFEIRTLFERGSAALLTHMEKEEQVLFPYIKAMVGSKREGFPLSKPHFEDIENPILCMEEEHQTEGKRFQKIAALTKGYTSPPDGCQTYKVAYALLKEFEKDLHRHIHLENNILFPSARRMFSTHVLGKEFTDVDDKNQNLA